MSQSDELLALAEELLALDRNRPRRVSLKRAVSTAYYALFHFLIEQAISATLGRDRSLNATQLQRRVSRWYGHNTMRDVSNWFRGRSTPQEVRTLLDQTSQHPKGIVPLGLERVCTAFVELQEARHSADYDVGRRFTRAEARALINSARTAIANWQSVEGLSVSRLYLLLLLTGKSPVQSR